MGTFARKAFEIRQRIQSEIYLSRRTAELISVDLFGKFRRQMFAADHFHEREPWVDTGRNDTRANFVSVLQHDAFRPSVFNNDPRDRNLRADLSAGFAGRTRNRIGDSARAAAHESPGTERAVDFAHVVMQQN